MKTTRAVSRTVKPVGTADVRAWSLVRLRWGSAAGQLLIILVAWRVADLPLPAATLFGLASLTVLTNAALWLWLGSGRSITTAWIGSIVAFDTLLLTGLLYVTGGASNPFSVFYLVQITAAASLTGSAWTWSVSALAVSCYAALFFLPAAPGDAEAEHMAQMMAGHLRGMWVALTLAAAITAYFVTRLTAGLARRDREIAVMRESAARLDRLSAVTTLAAGAAHELATPLTTVAVVAGELAAIGRRAAGRHEGPAGRGHPPDPRRGRPLPRDPRRHRHRSGKRVRRDAGAVHRGGVAGRGAPRSPAQGSRHG